MAAWSWWHYWAGDGCCPSQVPSWARRAWPHCAQHRVPAPALVASEGVLAFSIAGVAELHHYIGAYLAFSGWSAASASLETFVGACCQLQSLSSIGSRLDSSLCGLCAALQTLCQNHSWPGPAFQPNQCLEDLAGQTWDAFCHSAAQLCGTRAATSAPRAFWIRPQSRCWYSVSTRYAVWSGKRHVSVCPSALFALSGLHAAASPTLSGWASSF